MERVKHFICSLYVHHASWQQCCHRLWSPPPAAGLGERSSHLHCPPAMRDRGCAHSTELGSEEKGEAAGPVPKPGGAAVPCPCTSGLEGAAPGKEGWPPGAGAGLATHPGSSCRESLYCLCTSKALNLNFFIILGLGQSFIKFLVDD